MASFILTDSTVKVFDLLYLNGQPLIHKSTKFRKRNLKACIKEIQGRLELVAGFEARTAMDVRKRMEDVMAERGEGLVMKHPDAGYILNGRNKDWIKARIRFRFMERNMYSASYQVKPEYMVSELPYFCESAVANLSRTTWVKPWMRWLSVRRFCIRRGMLPQR
jgi:ATP dependent DNA ligase domain